MTAVIARADQVPAALTPAQYARRIATAARLHGTTARVAVIALALLIALVGAAAVAAVEVIGRAAILAAITATAIALTVRELTTPTPTTTA